MRALISALLLAVLAGPASALTQANHTDGGVTLRSNVSTGVVVDPGDPVSFTYQSVRDGAVLVFDVDTQGYVTLLTDHPINVNAHDTRNLPDDNSELFAEGQPGAEFVFAVAVDDPGAFDSDAIESLRDGSRRINGDPFIAANMITAEVVRNISQQTVFMGYTYFYVSDRVDYPCYLCGTCDGTGNNDCTGSHIAQNFDRGTSLVYPLARGYDVSEDAASTPVEDSTSDVAMPTQSDDVNFYPYGSEIHYADPVAMNLWYNWGWYDPYYWYYPYSYPYCGYPYGFSVGIGFGWGWGWGGYYCGGYYNPYYGCGGGGYYGGYPSYPVYSGNVAKFKSQYKGGANYANANTLAQNRSYAMKHDTNLQVASKGTKAWGTTVSYRSRTGTSSKTRMTNYPMASTRHVKTSVSGSRVVQGAWADGRAKSYAGSTSYRSRNSSMYKGNAGAGRTVMERGGYTSRSGASYGKGTTRTKSGSGYSSPNSSSRSRGSWSPSYNAPRSGGNSGTMRGYSGSHQSAPASRGWSGGGGSRGGYSGGGAMRGGGGGGGGAHGGKGR